MIKLFSVLLLAIAFSTSVYASKVEVAPFLSLYEKEIRLSFYTAEPARYTFLYQVAGDSYWKTQEESTPVNVHVFSLTGIPSEKTILYRGFSTAGNVEGSFFSPRSVFPVRVLLYGDSRWGHSTHRKILEIADKLEYDAILSTGDVVNQPESETDWEMFTQIVAPFAARKPFNLVVGNHDWSFPSQQQVMALPTFPETGYYSFCLGNTRWIVLNSVQAISTTSKQGKFLKEKLDESRKEGSIPILAFHHPPFSAGPHGQEKIITNLREFILPFIREYKIPLVISGHDHAFQRTVVEGTLFLVTAGAGAALYPQTYPLRESQLYLFSNHLVLLSIDVYGIEGTVYDSNGQVIDAFFHPFQQ